MGDPMVFLRSTSDVVSVRCILSNSGLDLTVLLTLLRSVCSVDADMEMPVGGSAELHARRLGLGAVDHAHEVPVPPFLSPPPPPIPPADPSVAAMAEAVAESSP